MEVLTRTWMDSSRIKQQRTNQMEKEDKTKLKFLLLGSFNGIISCEGASSLMGSILDQIVSLWP